MIGESFAASNCPFVFVSAVRANSGGQSVASRSWESRPLETPMDFARSVSDIAPVRPRYVLSVMLNGLDYLNPIVQAQSLGLRNDFDDGDGYYRRMLTPRHDWFLKEWLASFHPKKKQADIVNDLGWNKAKVSLMVRGLQPYTREEVNELATYLEIRPHELLMHPDDAHALRRLRAEMIRLAHETEEAEQPRKKVSLN